MITTFTGKLIDPQNPKPDDICLQDIAHALSLTCRYNGQCSKFYSVAEHSILMAQYDFLEGDTAVKLMHDSAEAYLGDMIRSIKYLLPDFSIMEDEFLKVIFAKYELDYDLLPEVKAADNTILATEASILMPENFMPQIPNFHPDNRIKLMFLNPYEGESVFLRVADYLNLKD